MDLNRRKYLAATGSITVTATAGCLGDDGDSVELLQDALGEGTAINQRAQARESLVDEHTDNFSIRTREVSAPREAGKRIIDCDTDIAEFSFFDRDVLGNEGIEDNDCEPLETFPAQDSWFYVVAREELDVETWEDLDGRTVWLFVPGVVTFELMSIVLDSAGIEVENNPVAPGDIGGELQRGNLDAVTWISNIFGPGTEEMSPFLIQAEQQTDLKHVRMSESTMEAAQDALPSYAGIDTATIESFETIDTQETDVVTGGGSTNWISSTVDEDIVYELLKIVFENTDQYNEMVGGSTFDYSRPETFPQFMAVNLMDGVELHPGAATFYDDQGIDV